MKALEYGKLEVIEVNVDDKELSDIENSCRSEKDSVEGKAENANLKSEATSQVAELETEVKSEDIESLVPDYEIIYNVETNNNFKPLACITSYSVNKDKEVLDTAKEEKQTCEDSEPKYSRAVRTNIKRGYNIFHISLLDIGLFNPRLKGFLAEEANEIKYRKEIKNLVMEHGESFGIGKFKADTAVFFNKKNNKGIEDLWTE